ncbi:MAG: hemerythrin family protein [Treponema sp.]|nr:hemerythrin family protein [Treponema sp.]
MIVDYRWDRTLETGHEMIDTQHKQLFVAINDLLHTYQQGKGSEDLSKSLDFLANYTIKHFFDEQRLQQKYNYPDFENHKKYHEALKAEVMDFSRQLIMKGPSEELINKVCSTIGNWLVNHIQIQDKKLAAYIKQQDAVAH